MAIQFSGGNFAEMEWSVVFKSGITFIYLKYDFLNCRDAAAIWTPAARNLIKTAGILPLSISFSPTKVMRIQLPTSHMRTYELMTEFHS
jgi:hypothetical protein